MNTTQRSNRTKLVIESREIHSWGFSDKKGREMGSRITLATHVFEAAELNQTSGWFYMVPGTYYAWVGQAMRGGEPFGAIQEWRFCKTKAERDAQVAEYIAGARDRAHRWAY